MFSSYKRAKGLMQKTDRLLDSSPTTLAWLDMIRARVGKEIPSLSYEESKHWATLKSPKTNRSVCYLNPQKSQIRLFTKLDSSYDSHLQPTPLSHGWAAQYPSIFVIRSESEIGKAVELISKSYEKDLRAGTTRTEVKSTTHLETDFKWFLEATDKQRAFRGKFVAIHNGQIIAHGGTFKEVFEKGKERLKGKTPLLAFIPKEEALEA